MLKTCKYRLYPNKQQQRLLEQQLEECRWLYNHLLAERRDAWEQRQASLCYPAHTSQDCSRCGHRQVLPLSDRTYSCPCCGLALDRDLNAALNILRLGQQSLASV